MRNWIIQAGVLAAIVVAPSAGLGSARAQGTVDSASEVHGPPSPLSKRAMTFADLQRIKRVSDPQVSPSGRWVMFSVAEVDLAKNSKVSHLWVVPLEASSKELAPPNSGSSHPTSAGTERQITFWKEGESGGRFSPDGKQILFVANDSATGQSQIFLAAWNEANGTVGTPERLTNVSTEADGAIWSPDSKRILFTSRVYPECSDETSWLEENACDKRKDDAAAANPVKAQVWDHLLYRHWDHYVGPKRSHVLVVSVTDGNAVRDLTPRRDIDGAEAPTFSLGGPLGYAWAPDSKEIAFVTNLDLVPAASTNNDVFTLRLDDPGARPRKISTSPGSDDAPAYSPDGKYIAFRSQARGGYESDLFRLMIFDRLTGSITEPMKGVLNRWVEEFVWLADSQHIGFISGLEGEAPYAEVGIDSHQRDFNDFRTRTDLPGEFSDLSALPNGAIIATRMMVNRPPEIVMVAAPVDRSNKSFAEAPLSVITHLNDGAMASLDLPPQESYWFTGAEGTKVQGFILHPPNFNPSRKYPVKFLIHGGPQGAWGNAWSYRWNAELMAASGYIIVMVNPRGSTGYGQAFIDGVNGDWGGKAYVDLMKGLDYAEQHYSFIDKTRECALGGSYGGFMANWILTHTDRFACIVSHDGMFNPQSAYGTTEELWFNEWEFRRPASAIKPGVTKARATAAGDDGPGQPWRYAGGPIADDPFRKWSPMLSIQNAKTPTLVIHSQRDYRLDVSEGLQLFTALQRLHVPSRMLYFPDEGHWVLKPQNSQLWYQEVGAWCDRWTKNDGSLVEIVAPAPAAAETRPVENSRRIETPPKPPTTTAPDRPATVTPAVPAAVPPAAAPRPGRSVHESKPPIIPGAAFSIAISVPQNEIKAGEDVPVTIIMTNVSDHQVLLSHKPGRDNGEFSFDIQVKDEAGKEVPDTPYGREARSIGQRREQARTVDYLQPGGTTVQVIHLEKLINLSRPGRYTVEVSRKDSLIDVVVRSNVLTFNVKR